MFPMTYALTEAERSALESVTEAAVLLFGAHATNEVAYIVEPGSLGRGFEVRFRISHNGTTVEIVKDITDYKAW